MRKRWRLRASRGHKHLAKADVETYRCISGLVSMVLSLKERAVSAAGFCTVAYLRACGAAVIGVTRTHLVFHWGVRSMAIVWHLSVTVQRYKQHFVKSA